MKHSFFLVIPRQQNSPNRLQEFEAKILQQWIDELPTANPELSARLLQDLIMDLNTIAMPAQLRLDTLELLRPSVLAIEDYIRSKLMASGFPKEDNDYRMLKLLVSIAKEFTIGYWIVVKDQTQRDVSWFQGKNVALSIQRSIKGLNSIVINFFIMGMPIPDWVWMDLHGFYRLSVKIKKNTTQVANDSGQFNKTSSPEQCYLQIVLLSLADPTGLMQKEVLVVYRFIETISSLVSLKSAPVAQPVQCLISTEEDAAPCFQSERNIDPESALLYIDFTKLYKAFEQKSIMISSSESRFNTIDVIRNTMEKPAAELLDYLIQRWSGINHQNIPLFSDRLDRYLAIGLIPAFNLQKSSKTSSEIDFEFLVQSESSSLLSCAFTKTGVLSVGSLVSLRKAYTEENTRLLGIVDKLIVAKEKNKIIFGVRMLAQQCAAVIYLPLEPRKNEIPKRALYYSTGEKDKDGYIILDTSIFKDGDAIRLFVNQENFVVIMLVHKKNIGLGYWQFECHKMTGLETTSAN